VTSCASTYAVSAFRADRIRCFSSGLKQGIVPFLICCFDYLRLPRLEVVVQDPPVFAVLFDLNARRLGQSMRNLHRLGYGMGHPPGAGGEGFNFEFSNSHFDDLLVAALLGTRTRIAFKYNNGVADSEITAVTDSSDTYTVNSGGASFKAGHLAKAEGFMNAANNRIFKVASSTGTTVVAAGTPTLTDETAPPGTAKLQVIGFEGASGDIWFFLADFNAID
jgi:hypothetical protein